MDGTPGYKTTLAFEANDLEKVIDYTDASALDFVSPDVSSSYFSKGSKRKCSTVDRPINLKDGSTLVLGLGRSSSSCTTTCSGKEIEEESSMHLGLGINLKIGDNKSPNPKKVSAGTLNALDIQKPNLDLQLSLSIGPAESDLTTVTQGFTPYQHYSDSPSLVHTIQLVDEGSTSSRWKTGPLVPPLQNVDISDPSVTLSISTTTGIPNLVGASSARVNPQQQRKTNVKTCRFEGCTRGARGASGLCIAHGGGRRCQKAGCQKGAEGKTVFCKAHGGGKRCQHLGCTKSAEGRTDYCIGHGGGRRCSHEGCIRAARGKSGLCIRHGGGKRCKFENCTKSAEGISGLCISHGGGRRCQYPDCTKGAQGSTMFCKAHGGGRRCTYLGCTKGAEGSTPYCKGHGGGKRCTFEGCTKSVHGGTLFCVSHGGGKRCAEPGCTKSARGRTNYCVRHGGGKRCKFEGCTKSAQGSTDFCKAHGGGKRCSWVGSGFTCDKFARGKSGLCAAHSAQVQEKQMNESFEMGSTSHYSGSTMPTQMKGGFAANDWGTTSIGSIGYGHQLISTAQESFMFGNACLDHMSLPEGRVHGGGLMAMLRGGTTFETTNNKQNGSGGNAGHLPHSWM
ncbi:hypothetical protein BUALT_Bualt06G0098600 [Buddleja alternifolia]|uniref:WRKY19-like zinc finger domain-containing protein n=1 Tax=Buddleja alternifolia TaxID=168488 RepID=A0AAV6XKZ0_9LAMI|nr:hypothetical protein BUALT_Bualt06G0098600 [Buddleja alternifolia]